MIILFGGEKGGAGKTTLATNIASIRRAREKDLLLVDTDRQSTASFWCGVREDNKDLLRISSIQKYDKSVRTEITQLQEKYSDIIIDAGGRDSPELRSSLLVCDIAIFPLRPSQFDLWTLGRLNTLVDQASDINSKLKAYVVVNQASPNPAVKESDEMKDFVSEFDNLLLSNAKISERISFRRAAIKGLGVVEYRPEDTKATEEISNLYNELYQDEK
jgi:chromosome partitioning protein